MIKKAVAVLCAVCFAPLCWAGPTCEVPPEKRIDEKVFKSRLEAEGYQIKVFKLTKGGCYEIYGHDKGGNKVEIYFNPETGEPVKTNRS